MSSMRWMTLLVAALVISPAVVSAQSTGDETNVPRTPWGAPDLKGVWDFRTATPLERPDAFAGRATLSEEEVLEFERTFAAGAGGGDFSILPGFAAPDAELWIDFGERMTNRRTSLIVNPSDGKIPDRTEAGEARAAAQTPPAMRPAGGPEDRALTERCLQPRVPITVGPAFNFLQLVQTPDHIAILQEFIHDVRVIPLTPSRLPAFNVRQWAGISRGHWDGDELVVETTHFNGRANFEGSSPNLRVLERFTRVDAHTLRYQFTVDDPETFTDPWSVEISMTHSDSRVYETACHEGNRSMPLILRSARVQELAQQRELR